MKEKKTATSILFIPSGPLALLTPLALLILSPLTPIRLLHPLGLLGFGVQSMPPLISI